MSKQYYTPGYDAETILNQVQTMGWTVTRRDNFYELRASIDSTTFVTLFPGDDAPMFSMRRASHADTILLDMFDAIGEDDYHQSNRSHSFSHCASGSISIGSG